MQYIDSWLTIFRFLFVLSIFQLLIGVAQRCYAINYEHCIWQETINCSEWLIIHRQPNPNPRLEQRELTHAILMYYVNIYFIFHITIFLTHLGSWYVYTSVSLFSLYMHICHMKPSITSQCIYTGTHDTTAYESLVQVMACRLLDSNPDPLTDQCMLIANWIFRAKHDEIRIKIQ